jgi:hypothetical protein
MCTYVDVQVIIINMKNKTITWVARSEYCEEVCPKPIPAAQMIPEWWKKMTPYIPSYDNPDGSKLIIKDSESNASWKKCTPLRDAMTSGYIIPLWTDVQVQRNKNIEDDWKVTWRVKGMDVFQYRGPNSDFIETPQGFAKQMMTYLNGWIPQTPPGYSVLITPPFGYRNLPFMTIPAIVDTDKHKIAVDAVGWFRNDFEGIIEKGTPLLQITPFKRENWESEFSVYTADKLKQLEDKTFRSTTVGQYIKNVWTRKVYK